MRIFLSIKFPSFFPHLKIFEININIYYFSLIKYVALISTFDFFLLKICSKILLTKKALKLCYTVFIYRDQIIRKFTFFTKPNQNDHVLN